MKLIFMGTPDIAVPFLEDLVASNHTIQEVITQPDQPRFRSKKALPSPVKQKALELQLPVFQPKRVSEVKAVEHLAQHGPDVIVVVAFGQLLSQSVLSLPRWGCINLHFSLLPRWRGAAPVQRAIEAGDPWTGVSVQKMVLDLDAGPLLAQEKMPIEPQDTSLTLWEKMVPLGKKLLQQTLQNIEQNQISSTEQDPQGICLAPKLQKTEQWINPLETTMAAFEQKVRAFQPWPGVCLKFESFPLKILQAQKIAKAAEQKHHKPAGWLFQKNHQLFLALQDGSLELTQVQIPGKKAVLAQDFLNGIQALSPLPWKVIV